MNDLLSKINKDSSLISENSDLSVSLSINDSDDDQTLIHKNQNNNDDRAEIDPSEHELSSESETSHDLNQFMLKANETKKKLRKMDNLIDDFEKAGESSLSAKRLKKTEEYSEEMKQILTTIDSKTTELKTILDELSQETNQTSKQYGDGLANIRIKQNNTEQLRTQFCQLLFKLSGVESNFQKRFREKIARQSKIVGLELSEDQIDTLAEKGASSQQIFFQANTHKQAKDVLATIESTHSAIIQLEVSINQIHEMFRDMAILVHMQSEKIDMILENVGNSKNYIEQGVVELQKAKKSQRKYRSKLCWIFIFVFVMIVLVVVLSVVFSVVN
ncbi:syntaxin-132 [Anaeramoeba flamelloides]|uniref:Syntaxin-132 n=1 Tax=Anaeramoeba flamelloides TaxID=1746091 RepID=A0ABQ8XJ35_9EUKA|nr:syntaxin-132 [Anaeramoeba flamelloides]